MAKLAETKTNSNPAAEAEKALQEAEKSMPAEPKRLRRLTPASHIQVAVRAMGAILKFNYNKFEMDAGYKAQEPNEEQTKRIVELKDQLFQLRAEFGNVRNGGGSGKPIEQRLTSMIKIVKAINPKLKGEELKEAVRTAYASAYNSSALVGYDELMETLIENN